MLFICSNFVSKLTYVVASRTGNWHFWCRLILFCFMFSIVWIRGLYTDHKMQSKEGRFIGLCIPRQSFLLSFLRSPGLVILWDWSYVLVGCSSATNRLITASERASFQINIGHLDESGVYTGHFSIFALWFCTNTGMYHYYLFYCFLNVLLNCMMVISPLHEELMLWELGSLKLDYFASLFFAFCSVPCLHDYLL